METILLPAELRFSWWKWIDGHGLSLGISYPALKDLDECHKGEINLHLPLLKMVPTSDLLVLTVNRSQLQTLQNQYLQLERGRSNFMENFTGCFVFFFNWNKQTNKRNLPRKYSIKGIWVRSKYLLFFFPSEICALYLQMLNSWKIKPTLKWKLRLFYEG